MSLKTVEATKAPFRFIVLSSAAASSNVRIRGTDYANICLDDLFFEKNKDDASIAYQQSKLANYLHVFEASKCDDFVSTVIKGPPLVLLFSA